jgi:NAD(P)-dependent dehydrogenase (short-subunit alcohol dehydrogenase family)
MTCCILITGCSSGIGAALAQEFHQRGHTVYATARRLESLAGLQQAGLRTLALDVNDDTSIATAMGVVQSEQGRLDALLQASPPMHVRGGKASTLFPLLKMLLPAQRFDAVLSRKFGLTDWTP